MACFSPIWFQSFLVWLAIVVFLVACIKLVVPYLATLFGQPPGGGIILTLLGYLMWLVIIIAIIYAAFGLFACVGGLGLGFPGGR